MPRRAAAFALSLPAMIFTTPASADILVSFQESAPKDVFTIVNEGPCLAEAFTLEIDLSGSAGGLFFDTTGSGAGYQTHQPFVLEIGAERVREVTPVGDGDTRVALRFWRLEPGERVVFTIDLDDASDAGGYGVTQVAGSEIAGARAVIDLGSGGRDAVGEFDDAAGARIPLGCAGLS